MSSSEPDPKDERMELVMAGLLRVGVVVAAIVVFGGAVAYLVGHAALPASHSIFRGEPVALRSLGQIVTGTWRGDSLSVIQFGLLLLVATPVVRVAFSVAAFARQRDRAYVFFTLIVLGILLYSLLFART